ncbi:MAG: DsbE family thiol:disulfide interchange protein [Oleiphilaceae bacterium]|nr:DsbE family thiol:disulfide interchange protein [Oleiphilaceae bacterium]
MNQRLVYITPIIVALGLGLILFTAIGKDPTRLETARLNDPIPAFKLQDLDNAKRMVDESVLKGKVRLLNVWATWCPACRAEHDYLQYLANQGVPIIGLNYKDDREAALKWLKQLGNPYEMNIYDPKGSLGFDLGVYGAPETYVIDAKGLVRYRHVGEVNARIWESKLAPLVRALQEDAAASARSPQEEDKV